MKKLYLSCFLTGFLLAFPYLLIKGQGGDPYAYMKSHDITQYSGTIKLSKPIVIAVVDDGFNMNHQLLKDYWFTNTNEISGNKFDDDKNGYVDDTRGWDVSDNDNDVSVISGREDFFYHGTYIVGVISSILKRTFGEKAKEYFRILPVKVLSDDATNGLIIDGYKGVEYLTAINPDIVCLAWSGGVCTKDEEELFNRLSSHGSIILSSSGNSFSKTPQYPAALANVLAISAVDSAFKKLPQSNYGDYVDFSAIGSQIPGAHSGSDSLMLIGKNTSASVAVCTGIVSALKVLYPGLPSSQIIETLENTSKPIDVENPGYAGRLGAGLPQLNAALEYLKNKNGKTVWSTTKGYVPVTSSFNTLQRIIDPKGAYEGIWITPVEFPTKGNKSIVNFYNSVDSLFAAYSIDKFPPRVHIPFHPVKILLNGKMPPNEEFLLQYETENIDSTELYCKDVVYLKQEHGIINDGSGNENYANNCSCKWQITVPEGKRIKIDFTQMDIQTNVDWVYIFDGTETLQENWLAKFTGQKIPPSITTSGNQVLIWFITDGNTTGNGWELRYDSF